jgi:hypothetical protein
MVSLVLRKGSTEMNAEIVYEGKLSNGIKYKIHQSNGFSNKCDIAISIEDKYVSVTTIAPKRSGNIDVIPMTIGRQIVGLSKQDTITEAPTESTVVIKKPVDLLSDVITNQKSTEVNNG